MVNLLKFLDFTDFRRSDCLIQACTMSLRIEKGVLLVTAVLVFLVKGIASCPDKCVCSGNQEDGMTVTCNHANITSLPSNISIDTVELHIQGNNLTRLGNDSFLNLTRLERLYLQDNHIQNIEHGAFRGLDRLRVLKLSDNPIGKIDIFNGIDTLEELEANRCELTSLDDDSFSGLVALKRLSVDSNRIEQISAQMLVGLTTLEMFSVEDNRLFELPLSESASSLKQLCLSGNPLSTFGEKPFLKYDVLEVLHMSRVSSSGEIPDDIFGGIEDTLTELGIGSNNLTRVPAAIKKLNKLKILDLSGNKLQEYDYSAAMAKLDLQKLFLSDNRFTNLPSEVLPMFADLEELSLDDNSITSIPSNVLSRCTLLQVVSLKNNKITKVANDAFQGLQNLKSVDLSGNNLTTLLSDGPFVGTRGMSLLLDGNPWHCDCQVLWLSKWYEAGKINPGETTPTCQTPQSLKDQSLLDLSVEILSDCKKPVATSDISALTAKEDTRVTLSCRVDGFPTPTVAWYTTHGKITSESPNDTYDKKYTIQNTSLNINNVEVSDQGKYTCFATNIVGNASVDITLSVRVKPTPTISPKMTVTHTPAYTMKSTLHPSIKQRTGSSELSQSDLGMIIFGSFTVVAIGVSVLVHWYCKKRQREDDEEHRSIAYDNRTFSAFDDSDVEII